MTVFQVSQPNKLNFCPAIYHQTSTSFMTMHLNVNFQTQSTVTFDTSDWALFQIILLLSYAN